MPKFWRPNPHDQQQFRPFLELFFLLIVWKTKLKIIGIGMNIMISRYHTNNRKLKQTTTTTATRTSLNERFKGQMQRNWA